VECVCTRVCERERQIERQRAEQTQICMCMQVFVSAAKASDTKGALQMLEMSMRKPFNDRNTDLNEFP